MDALDRNNEVPAAYFALSYQQRDITYDISAHLLSLDYSDYLSGQSDELSVSLENTEGKWTGPWYPGHGDRLSLALGWQGQAPRLLGEFVIDEIEVSLSPATVNIRALAASITSAVRTPEHRAYEQLSLPAVVQQIAARQGLTLVGKIEPIQFDRLTQQEGDLAFLRQLADEYDYAFKVRGQQLVFHAISDLASAVPVAEVAINELRSASFRDQIKQVPKAAEVKHKDPASKQLVSVRVANSQSHALPSSASQTSSSADTRKVRSRSTTLSVATAKAQAELAKANRERTTSSWSMMGRPHLISGNVLNLTSADVLAGHYLITASRHSFSRSSGYSSEQQLCRVRLPDDAANNATDAPPALQSFGLDSPERTA
ncbi:phage late control D family protein [Pseudomonas sp. 5P_3.1_Bac2]|uniref:phage late control D family protein n=1 Tax=Pseudomonas sp. 5P_3.1_Bac2 TaxID=2971617 RepID=UPI0021C56A0D|nr:late control protein D [Pseudomonas sp. 5P_3.1_Bac2]MCU1718673.1 late control protein D [Pseudomonas sp. 5P_3.1_Bac2]